MIYHTPYVYLPYVAQAKPSVVVTKRKKKRKRV